MQQYKKQLPVKFSRLHGLAVLFAMLFIVAQAMTSFHSHDPSSAHEDTEPAPLQVECGVCLIANMPSYSGGDIELVNAPTYQGEPAIAALNMPWHDQSVLPTQARAPPRA